MKCHEFEENIITRTCPGGFRRKTNQVNERLQCEQWRVDKLVEHYDSDLSNALPLAGLCISGGGSTQKDLREYVWKNIGQWQKKNRILFIQNDV